MIFAEYKSGYALYGGILKKDCERARIIAVTVNPAWAINRVDIAIVETDRRMLKRNVAPITPNRWVKDEELLKVRTFSFVFFEPKHLEP